MKRLNVLTFVMTLACLALLTTAAIKTNPLKTGVSESFDVRKKARFYEDYSNAASVGTTAFASGTGTGVALNNGQRGPYHHGMIRHLTGTTATGITSSYFNSNLEFGGGFDCSSSIYITALSTASEEYVLYVGFKDDVIAGAGAHGVYFLYDRTQSVNWLMVADDDSGTTAQDTGVAVATGWNDLRMIMKSDYSSVQAYVGGVAAGSAVSTNLPDSDVDDSWLLFQAEATVGTTEKGPFYMDYLYCELDRE